MGQILPQYRERLIKPFFPASSFSQDSIQNFLFHRTACTTYQGVHSDFPCFYLGAAAQKHAEAAEDEDRETPNYEEKAQEIVQSILQEVVNTVAGGKISFSLVCLSLCFIFKGSD